MSSNDSPNGDATLTPQSAHNASTSNTSPQPVTSSAHGISSTAPPADNAGASLTNSNARPTTAVQSHPPQLNPRSCVTCRRRKVRCNKREPCLNCVKAGIECIFPGPGRAPRKPRRPPDAELLSRLRRLEGVVESLGGTAAIDRLTSEKATVSPPPTAIEDSKAKAPDRGKDPYPYLESSDPKEVQLKKDVQEEFGRLVIDDQRSRYVSNRFWASLGDQIEELQDILDPSTEDEDDYPSPEDSVRSGSQNHDAFLFGYHSLAHSLRNYHPSPTQFFVLWKTYEQNIAALVTVLHKPSIRYILLDAATSLDSLDKNTEALAFAVYLSAVISMTPEQCMLELGEERDATIRRFRFATEQALARGSLLNSQSLTLLQAATLFLTSIRRQDDTRFVWTLSAVVLRLATGLGLHRDGSNFGLSPFETEMRRRIWWDICILDVRAAEDHGTDPMITDLIYDTHLPSNINDNDIEPGTKTHPPERVGCTDMTFSLIRCEVTLAYRRLTYVPPGSCAVTQTVEQRANLIEELNTRLNERYIRHCDMEVPLQWVCATVARLIVAKMWLIVHHPLARNEKMPAMSHEARNRLLLTSIEIIEFSHLLETNEHTARWGWLFRTYIQWHAVAFVLAELCVRPLCPGVDRAWAAVNSVFTDWEREAVQKKGMLWRPLSRLMKRAGEFRKEQQEELGANYGSHRPMFRLEPSSVLKTGVGNVMNMSQLSSPLQTISTADSILQPPAFGLPQKPQHPGPKGINIDLSKGVPDLLNEILPSYYYVEPPAPVSTGPLNPSQSVPTTSSDAIDTATTFAAAPGTLDELDVPLNWDQFDNVMRDFQIDMEQTSGIPIMGDVMDLL